MQHKFQPFDKFVNSKTWLNLLSTYVKSSNNKKVLCIFFAYICNFSELFLLENYSSKNYAKNILIMNEL